MVFSSPVFLFLFLPACLLFALLASGVDRALHASLSREGAGAGRALGRHPVENLVLVIFSLAFYLYGAGPQSLILLGSIAASHVCGLVIGHTSFRRTGLAVSVVAQLSVLAWFKFANFFAEQVSLVAGAAGLTVSPWTAVLLPAGVSFFVFHAISYTIDIYRRQCEPLRSPLDVALYITMFPQLIAGPIVRFSLVASQLHDRRSSLDDIGRGLLRFVYGLCKKVLVADAVGEVAGAAFDLPATEMTAAAALIGAFAYTFQIYFDFSAYSDMAIGLGRVFGFRFPENFQRPFSAVSVTDFWRRWHMTLSFWFRDYVYKPLGGSRTASWRTGFNLWVVFLLSGLWHGATWTFVVWGAYHGAWLTLERAFRTQDAAENPPQPPRKSALALHRLRTFLIVVVGFTLFRADSFGQAMTFYRHMFVPNDWHLPLDLALLLTHKNVLLLVVAVVTLLFPPSFSMGRWLESDDRVVEQGGLSGPLLASARLIVMTVGLLVASTLIASNNFSPFIYFRF